MSELIRRVTKKTKIAVVVLEVDAQGQQVPFELQLPGNIKRINKVSISATLKGAALTPLATTCHYHGLANDPGAGSYDNAFIQSLNRELLVSKYKNFTYNNNDTKYVFYARPKRLGAAYFEIDGVNGGFSLIDTVSVTDPDNGFIEDYYLYMADFNNLNLITVQVS